MVQRGGGVDGTPDLLQDRFDEGGKTRNIAFPHVLQQCFKTSCAFFVALFPVPEL